MILAVFGGIAAAVGGAYSWATSVYSYNREAWMTDIQVLQNHDYQYDNLQINTHQMSRDQIRDRTEAAITKLNNFILVTTLIIALAGEMLVEGQIPPQCADFVLNVYMLSLGSAFLYLALGTLLGITASNVIYEASQELLTTKVPPPWAVIDKKMRKRESKKMTQAFESRPLRQMFMPPLFRRLDVAASSQAASSELGVWGSLSERGRCYSEEAEALLQEDHGGAAAMVEEGRSEQLPDAGSPCSFRPADAKAGDEEQELRLISEDYDNCWFHQERTWMPLFGFSRKCVALGVHGLLQAYGYLCMATLYGDFGSAWAFWMVQIIFTFLNIMVTQAMFELGSSGYGFLLVAVGPFSCALAATTPYKWLDRVLVPLCYTSHLILHNLLNIPAGAHKSISVHGGGLLCETIGPKDLDEDELNFESPSAHGEAGPSSVMVHCRSALSRQSPASEHRVAEKQSKRKLRRMRRTVKQMVWGGSYVMRALWAFSVLWSLCKSYSGGDDYNNEASVISNPLIRPPVVDTTKFTVHWPSPYFRPRAMDCSQRSDHQLFIADEFQIYALPLGDKSNLKLVATHCKIENGTIADISATCNDDNSECWPQVLMADAPPRIYDCSSQTFQNLLQTRGQPSRLASAGAHQKSKIYVEVDEKVIEYQWSQLRNGWAPRWAIASTKNSNGLSGVDVVDEDLFLFHEVDRRTVSDSSTIEVLDLKKGESCGLWELPRNLNGAGCAMTNNDVYVISQSDGFTDEPELFKGDLEMLPESPCSRASGTQLSSSTTQASPHGSEARFQGYSSTQGPPSGHSLGPVIGVDLGPAPGGRGRP